MRNAHRCVERTNPYRLQRSWRVVGSSGRALDARQLAIEQFAPEALTQATTVRHA
jgi:hypothetical protein